MFKKILSYIILVCFFTNTLGPMPKAWAAVIPAKARIQYLPEPGTMVNLSPAYAPVLIKGLRVHPENPFKFDFIVDTGNFSLPPVGRDRQGVLKTESNRLIKYFLAALTVPEKDLWVNLSPYEKNRMIADNLGQTEMGRDMLAQDYILKQLTASLIYPEKELGQKFWDKIYAKAQAMYGSTQIPVNTFNKVWIVADKADVFERANVAYVVGAHLKVMLEEDYTALNKQMASPTNAVIPESFNRESSTQSHSIASQVVREIILPEIEHEVNEGKNFAPLRQMFYSMILASWFKMALKDAVLSQVYGNQSKLSGLSLRGAAGDDAILTPDQIYNRYIQAYKKGVFNYIKEEDSLPPVGRVREVAHQTIPRKYFSGGTDFAMLHDPAMLRSVSSIPPTAKLSVGKIYNISGIGLTLAPKTAAMISLERTQEGLEKLSQESLHEVTAEVSGRGGFASKLSDHSVREVGRFLEASFKPGELRMITNALRSVEAIDLWLVMPNRNSNVTWDEVRVRLMDRGIGPESGAYIAIKSFFEDNTVSDKLAMASNTIDFLVRVLDRVDFYGHPVELLRTDDVVIAKNRDILKMLAKDLRNGDRIQFSYKDGFILGVKSTKPNERTGGSSKDLSAEEVKIVAKSPNGLISFEKLAHPNLVRALILYNQEITKGSEHKLAKAVSLYFGELLNNEVRNIAAGHLVRLGMVRANKFQLKQSNIWRGNRYFLEAGQVAGNVQALVPGLLGGKLRVQEGVYFNDKGEVFYVVGDPRKEGRFICYHDRSFVRTFAAGISLAVADGILFLGHIDFSVPFLAGALAASILGAYSFTSRTIIRGVEDDILPQLVGTSFLSMDTLQSLAHIPDEEAAKSPAMKTVVPNQVSPTGGIDFDSSRLQMRVSKDAVMGGVAMTVDQAMIKQIKENDCGGIQFKIETITPISLLVFLGLRKEEEEQLNLPQLAAI